MDTITPSLLDTAALEELASRPESERRPGLLRWILNHGGLLTPYWEVGDPYGYVYWRGIGIETRETFDDDLAYLTRHDYLRTEHFDRLNRCPGCDSYVLNIREVCPSCNSSNLQCYPVLHHFRCGYVAPIMEYGSKDETQHRCPKCAHYLRYLGTDHEVVGEQFSCRSCGASFDEPLVEALCMSCGARTSSEELTFDEIRQYRVTKLGHSAVRARRLFDGEDEAIMEAGLPLFRRSIFLRLLRDDLRRWKRYTIPFSLLILRVTYLQAHRQTELEQGVLERVRDLLRTVDQMGRLNENTVLVNLPSTDRQGAEIVLGRMIAVAKCKDEVDANGKVAELDEETTIESDLTRQSRALA